MQKIFNCIDKIENFTLVWTILSLAIIGFIQVITRYVFNFSFPWFEELGRYLGVFVAFLGGSIGVKNNSHFSMDLIVSRMEPPWRQIVTLVSTILSASFCLMVACYSLQSIGRMHGYGTTSPVMQIPMYIAYLPIPVFCFSMGLRYLKIAFIESKKLLVGKKPVGEKEGAS